MYYKDYRINSFDVDGYGHLTVPNLFKYLQDIMLRNANSYGAGTDYHREKGLVWVLVDYEINIYKLPRINDVITCGTIPYSFKRFYGFRKYKILDKNGYTIASGHSKFVLINYKTKAVVTPSDEVLQLFKDAVKEPKVLKFVKHFKNDNELVLSDSIKVKNTFIDINNHVNNVYYVIFAYNELTTKEINDFALCTVRVSFKKEAYLNDKLDIYKQVGPENIYFQIKRDDILLSEVSFRVKQIKNDD